MPNSTEIKTLTLSDGTYNNTLPLEDTTARNSIASLAASLAPVATSGSYNDLADKPDIPEELVVDFSHDGSTWECDTPVVDIINAMASNVRVYALNDGLIFEGVRYISSDEYVEFIARAKNMMYILAGTYNSVVDNWSIEAYAIVDYDDYQSDMAGKQNTLVSGSNIKTINGQSLLGSGNISIQGSGDYTHTASTFQSGTVAVTFAANQRCSVMYGASADLALAITCNNGADNYIWVQNTGTADIDITISSVTYNNSSLEASKIFLPSDGITVPKGCVCEIGVLCNADGAFITARADLKASS